MGTSSRAIQPFLPPLTSGKGWNGCKYIVANNIHFFCHGKPSPTSPATILSLRKPHWHRLPNWEEMAPQVCPPASSRTPWSAKTSQMGLLYPATPKIYNFPPPNLPSSDHHHPPATSAIVYIYLLVPPTPTQQPRPPIRHPQQV